MERWRRLAIAASVGSTLLCLGLILAPYLYSLGSLGLARWRWTQHGSPNYTVTVAQLCNCAFGEYRLTVRGGQVVAVETVGAVGPVTSGGPNPAGFREMTVEATFARAGRSLRENWWPGSRERTRVEFDAALGYVTRLDSFEPAAPHLFFTYVARDLQLDSP